jgi:hypothetical protein
MAAARKAKNQRPVMPSMAASVGAAGSYATATVSPSFQKELRTKLVNRMTSPVAVVRTPRPSRLYKITRR